MGSGHIVIAGHCSVDDIHQADGHVLPATPGGAAAYATLGAAMYGARITLVTRLGDDYPFDRFRDGLAGHGVVDTAGVRWLGPRCIHNIAWYRADGNRHFDIESWDVMEELTPTADDLSPEIVQDAVVLLTPGTLTKQLEATRRVRAQDRPVVVDTEIHYFPDDERKGLLRAVVAEASYFLPSIEHLQVLYDSPCDEVEAYLDRLPALGCPWVIVKQGTRGSTVMDCTEGQSWHVPAVRDVAVRDVTGAGDGFSGGFTAALSEGKDVLEAACWGTVTASFVVESVGAVIPPHFDRRLAVSRYTGVREGVTEVCAAGSVRGGRGGEG
ncbi:MAG TPA: carbohydrate kinase family protein [Chloroflexota bacterium]